MVKISDFGFWKMAKTNIDSEDIYERIEARLYRNIGPHVHII